MRTSTLSCRPCGSLAIALQVALLLLSGAALAPSARANAFVQLDFNISTPSRLRDSVFIVLFDDRPLTRDNFLQYVNGGHYDNSLMHRLARQQSGEPFVLQGGGFYPKFQPGPPPLNTSLDPDEHVDLDDNPATPLPTVPNEFANEPLRSNVRGTLAMARLPGSPNSATSQFFFNLANNGGTPPNGLDFQDGGFTVFAAVVGDGMSLIGAYNTLPVANLNEDANNDGVPDIGPFTEVPVLFGQTSFLPLVLERATRIDYLGAGLTTNVPPTGLTFAERDAFIDTGAIFTGTGALAIGPGRTLGIREGTSLARALINRGTLAPGLQLGSITVENYQQFLTGTLEIQLRKTSTDMLHDQLVVNEEAFLSGVLDVALAPGFAPAHGDTFTVLTAGEIIGNFVAADLPLLGGGLVWSYSRTATAIILGVARADYNRNGIVDAADYLIWRKTFGQTGTGLVADGNGDGKIDGADYNIWKSNFGNISGTPPASGSLATMPVPEPSAALLMVAAGGFLAACRQVLPRKSDRKFT